MADASAPRPAVLLVEDDPVQLMEAAAALREAGYAVAEASTVEAAQAHLAARPDLVAMVADVDLAGAPLTGFTLAKAVAARWPERAILIVSGFAWPAEGEVPMGAGYLRKPFTADGLAKALRAVLTARGLHDSDAAPEHGATGSGPEAR
jgi:DNA-binding response OmpR family regulator